MNAIFCLLTFIILQQSPLLSDIFEPVEICCQDLYEGDCKGDFVGDLLFEMSDGSGWKVHSKDHETAGKWESGDKVHVSLRTSFYWFKREHKFFLYNHTRNESVRAMLIYHADVPREIIHITESYPTKFASVPIYEIDEEGEQVIVGYYISEGEWRKIVVLDDGTAWIIQDNFNEFTTGCGVYVGRDDSKSEPRYFLITGRERWAKWTYITPACSEGICQ